MSCGRRAIVGVAVEGESISTALKKALQGCFVLNLREHSPTLSGYNVFGVDLFVSLNPVFDMARARHAHPAMIAVACIVADDPRWNEEVCDHFDILMAQTEPLAAKLQARFGRPVSALSMSEEIFATALTAEVLRFTGERHKISVKSPIDDLRGYEGLKRVLQADGHRVRLDSPKRWACRQKVRDDVVLWGSMPDDEVVQEGSVNIALFDANASQSSLFDAVYSDPCDEGELGYEDLKKIIENCVTERLHVPIDPPLIDRSMEAPSNPIDGWLEKSDPVRELLDM